MKVCLKEAEAYKKMAETSLGHVEAKNDQLNQEVKDLKEELSLEKRAQDVVQWEMADFEARKSEAIEAYNAFKECHQE